MPIDSIALGCVFFYSCSWQSNTCPIFAVEHLKTRFALRLIVNKLAASCSMVMEYVTWSNALRILYYFPIHLTTLSYFPRSPKMSKSNEIDQLIEFTCLTYGQDKINSWSSLLFHIIINKFDRPCEWRRQVFCSFYYSYLVSNWYEWYGIRRTRKASKIMCELDQ